MKFKRLTIALWIYGFWMLSLAVIFGDFIAYIVGALCSIGGIFNEYLPEGLYQFLKDVFREEKTEESREGK